jgi:uncharacterized membrane protein
MRLGVSSTGAFMLLAASLLGSYFNMPVWHLPAETVSAAREIDFFGVRYVVPTVVQWPGTIIEPICCSISTGSMGLCSGRIDRRRRNL